jgi:hypothetical protein
MKGTMVQLVAHLALPDRDNCVEALSPHCVTAVGIGQAANSQLPWRVLVVIYIYSHVVNKRLWFVSLPNRAILKFLYYHLLGGIKTISKDFLILSTNLLLSAHF